MGYVVHNGHHLSYIDTHISLSIREVVSMAGWKANSIKKNVELPNA